MKRILGLLAATAAVGLIGGAAAQAQVSLRFGWATTASETDSYNFAAHRFSEALENAAPGDFKVSFFPNRQLGDEKEMMQGLRLGTVDVAVITNPVIANVEPAFLVNDLPFLYAGPEQVYATLDGKLGADACFSAAIALFGGVLVSSGRDLVDLVWGNTSPAIQYPMQALYLAVPVSGALMVLHSVARLLGGGPRSAP